MTPRRFWVAVTAVALVAMSLQLPSLAMGFVWDDLNSFSADTDALGCLSGPGACFTHAASGHYYRPLFGASMMASFHAFGGAPGPMHAENLGWFALELALVFAIARRVFGAADPRAVLALAIVALHPIQNSAVTWVTGRADMLPLVALLATTLLLLEGCGGMSAVTFALAVFAKEHAAAFIVVVPLLARSNRGKIFAAYAAVIAAWGLVAQALLLATAVASWPGTAGEHARVVVRTIAHMFRTLFAPSNGALHRLTASHWDTLEAWEVVTALVGVSAWLAIGFAVRRMPMLVWWVWVTVLLVPVVNVVPLGVALSTHRYVLALFGLAMLGAAWVGALAKGSSRRASGVWGLASLVAAALALVTFVDQPVWASNAELGAAVLEADPENVEWLLAASSVAREQGDERGALAMLNRAVETYFPGARSGAERVAMKSGRRVAEFNSLGRSAEPAAWLAGPLCLRGRLLAELGQFDAAIDDVTACVALFPQPQWETLRVRLLHDARR